MFVNLRVDVFGEQDEASEQAGCESPPYLRSSHRHSVTLRTPSFLSVCSLEVLQNESVPFPRTSGARFCGAGVLVFALHYTCTYVQPFVMYIQVQRQIEFETPTVAVL